MAKQYDFSGYATKNDIKCADGRTIRKNAFKACDGQTVPLVWSHSHANPADVLGHCLLENREDGVYTYGSFNETDAGKNAKELVRHGDVKALSIYANKLVQKGGDVLHGMIREVSLCLAGANPGAMIEDLSFEHFDDEDAEFEAQIWNGDNIELYHSEDPEPAKEEPAEEKVIAHAEKESDEENKEEPKMAENNEKTIKDVYESFTDEQKKVVDFMIGYAIENADKKNKENDDEEDDEEMMKHAYAGDDIRQEAVLAHDGMTSMIKDAKKYGSLRESFNAYMENDEAIAHAIDTTGMVLPETTNAAYKTAVGYGINSMDMLFPEARNLNNPPEFISRDMDWVKVVWGGVHRTPYSRIRSTFANITEDEARAKGYIKGKMKKEEFFSIMKRVTVPQTIYKKQKVDRDDITDITDFDVVRWIRQEMRMMWDEEVARAILIGDGRTGSDEDKISEEHIRPIVSDKPLFTIQQTVTRGADESATAKNFMKAAIRARKNYKGSGNPTLFTTEDVLTSMLLIEDGIGHYIYKSEAELATALRVSRIVTVPVMEDFTLENGNELMGVIVNLNDYNVGTDKGGEVTMFDDFDIDYNQYKYLIESRCSGALIKPFSAITLSVPAAASSGDGDGDGDGANP